MNIAILGPLDHIGGGPRVALELYKEWKQDHHVDLITDFYNPPSTFKELAKIPVIQLQYLFSSIPFLRRWTSLLAWFRLDLSRYDVVISLHSNSHLASYRNKNQVAYCLSLRTVFFDHQWSSFPRPFQYLDYMMHRPVFWLEKRILRSHKRVISISGFQSRLFHYFYEMQPPVCPLGISVSSAPEDIKKVQAPYALYVGRLSPEKRIDLIIRSWEQVPSTLQLLIAGAGVPTYVKYLETLAKPFKNVHFLGACEPNTLASLYKQSFMVVYPTKDEDQGLVPLEAMAFAKPVIVTNEGAFPEFVRDGENGRLIEPTPSSLAEAVTALFENPKKAAELGINGKRLAESYLWKYRAKNLLETCQTLLRSHA